MNDNTLTNYGIKNNFTVDDIHYVIASLSKKERDKILIHCKQKVRCLDIANVGVYIKTLLALLPKSLKEIKFWFVGSADCRKKGDKVIFTFLCYLDEIQVAAWVNKKINVQILSIVNNFLLNIDTDSKHVAWMAGDMLGDHWDIDESLPILMNIATNGKYVAGRISAINGLLKIVKRISKKRGKIFKIIVDEFDNILLKERSAIVKDYLEYSLKRERIGD